MHMYVCVCVIVFDWQTHANHRRRRGAAKQAADGKAEAAVVGCIIHTNLHFNAF